jgi:hypothetical protein
MKILFELFGVLTEKEVNRGNDIEAIAFYLSYTLRPLVHLLRIIHDPTRHNFHTRYVHYDLPPDDVERLKRLYFVRDLEDLRVKQEEARSWFGSLIEKYSEGPFTEDIERAAAGAREG